ncbi:MAG: Gfo/Idh/MocA family oxidoreductase [Planctomycetes bacterium]|nr:Gfo/Idh/MocA family oxidoreductase [Planctomycetota bacterium]
MEKLIGLIGAGNIAESHVRAIKQFPELKLACVVRRDLEKCKQFTSKYGGKPYTDYRDIFEDGVDIVTVALPHYLHFEVTMTAIKRGCHVLLEKPVALNLDECRKIIKAAKENNVKVMTANCTYMYPGVLKAKEIISSGRLGKFIMGSIISYRFYFTEERPDWFLQKKLAGGGQLFNLGVHRMAVVRSIISVKEVSVKATVGFFQKGCDVEGNGMIFVGYEDETAILIEECGYFEVPQKLNTGMHFVFENGIIGDLTGKMWISDRRGNIEYPELPPEPSGGPYESLYREMLSAINDNREPYPSIIEGSKDVRIILAAYESATTGKQVDLTVKEWDLDNDKEE